MRGPILQLLCLAFLMAYASGFLVSPPNGRMGVILQLHPNQGDILLKESAKGHQLKPAAATSASKTRGKAAPLNVLAWCRKVFGAQKTKDTTRAAQPTQ